MTCSSNGGVMIALGRGTGDSVSTMREGGSSGAHIRVQHVLVRVLSRLRAVLGLQQPGGHRIVPACIHTHRSALQHTDNGVSPVELFHLVVLGLHGQKEISPQ